MFVLRPPAVKPTVPSATALLCYLMPVFLLTPRALSALPLGDERDFWSNLQLPSAIVAFESASRTFTIRTGRVAVAGDLEIGSQFGPSNPGWHYGTTGTLGGTFSLGLGITRLHISPTGVVTDSDSIINLAFDSGAAGGLGTDYGIGFGRTLLRGVATEVLIDAAGEDTLDILFSITGGDLQELPNQQVPLGKFAPGNVGLIRITAPNLPSNWTSSFSVTATSLHVFGIPEPGTCVLASLAGLFMALARLRTRRFRTQLLSSPGR